MSMASKLHTEWKAVSRVLAKFDNKFESLTLAQYAPSVPFGCCCCCCCCARARVCVCVCVFVLCVCDAVGLVVIVDSPLCGERVHLLTFCFHYAGVWAFPRHFHVRLAWLMGFDPLS